MLLKLSILCPSLPLYVVSYSNITSFAVSVDLYVTSIENEGTMLKKKDIFKQWSVFHVSLADVSKLIQNSLFKINLPQTFVTFSENKHNKSSKIFYD